MADIVFIFNRSIGGTATLLAFLLFGYGQFRQFGVSRRLIFEMEVHSTTSHISQQRLWILDIFKRCACFMVATLSYAAVNGGSIG